MFGFFFFSRATRGVSCPSLRCTSAACPGAAPSSAGASPPTRSTTPATGSSCPGSVLLLSGPPPQKKMGQSCHVTPLDSRRNEFRQNPPASLAPHQHGPVEGDFAAAISLYHAYERLLQVCVCVCGWVCAPFRILTHCTLVGKLNPEFKKNLFLSNHVTSLSFLARAKIVPEVHGGRHVARLQAQEAQVRFLHTTTPIR